MTSRPVRDDRGNFRSLGGISRSFTEYSRFLKGSSGFTCRSRFTSGFKVIPGCDVDLFVYPDQPHSI